MTLPFFPNYKFLFVSPVSLADGWQDLAVVLCVNVALIDTVAVAQFTSYARAAVKFIKNISSTESAKLIVCFRRKIMRAPAIRPRMASHLLRAI